MLYIKKPYYRIARPLFTSKEESESYLYDADYAKNMDDQIRTAFYLEDQIVKLFEYIEPAEGNKKVFSNKMWQLLVQICTEVESNFKTILSSNGYKKNDKPLSEANCNMKDDYYKVNDPMKLHLYRVNLQWRENEKSTKLELTPFEAWGKDSYASLKWYQAYNSVKHNRFEKFEEANFFNVLKSFAALRVLLYAQFLGVSCSRLKISSMTLSEVDAICDEQFSENDDSPSKIELYDEAKFFNGSLFEVMPLKTSDWEDSEKYEFDWGSIGTDRFDKYPFYINDK